MSQAEYYPTLPRQLSTKKPHPSFLQTRRFLSETANNSAADLYAGCSPDWGVAFDLKSSTKRIVSQIVVATLNFT
jgi:hypothetical protein